jgi:hypothetical protein
MQMTFPGDLLLSAQRAFLGRIHPQLRVIKAAMKENEIVIFVMMDCEPSEQVREDVSEATTEIIADLPAGTMIAERFATDSSPLQKENALKWYWIYQRADNL